MDLDAGTAGASSTAAAAPRVELPDLPPELSGLRIAHVSDIHIGNGYDPAQTARLVDQINGLGAVATSPVSTFRKPAADRFTTTATLPQPTTP